jgi:hypothetical protein
MDGTRERLDFHAAFARLAQHDCAGRLAKMDADSGVFGLLPDPESWRFVDDCTKGSVHQVSLANRA